MAKILPVRFATADDPIFSEPLTLSFLRNGRRTNDGSESSEAERSSDASAYRERLLDPSEFEAESRTQEFQELLLDRARHLFGSSSDSTTSPAPQASKEGSFESSQEPEPSPDASDSDSPDEMGETKK